jgi:hypothetical protein
LANLAFITFILIVGFVLGFAARSYVSYRRRQRARLHRVEGLTLNELPSFVKSRAAEQTKQ